jgi:hypothetical protein
MGTVQKAQRNDTQSTFTQYFEIRRRVERAEALFIGIMTAVWGFALLAYVFLS